MPGAAHTVFAPGRVNLIGDHVDYVGGLVLPMAIDLGTTIRITQSDESPAVVRLESESEPEPALIELPVDAIADRSPTWSRYAAAVLSEMGATTGFRGEITTTLPVGAGLSSSASLETAVAIAAGFDGSPIELARLCQRAEHRASGVPCGIMDQLAIAAGVAGSALLIDCRDESVEAVMLPAGVAIHAIHCGVSRRLAGSGYADRRASCEAAERTIGPLRDAAIDRLGELAGVERRRARHVITEIDRVRQAASASRAGDAGRFGSLMNESHASLRDDFEVSIPELDQLVERLQSTPGVHGARLTGAGFGGCAVALVDADTDPAIIGGWRLSPRAGAGVVS